MVVIFWAEHKDAFKSGARKMLRDLFALLKTQRFAIVCFAIMGLFFYPSGQGYRALSSSPDSASPPNLIVYAYHIILNFFGLYNQSGVLNIIQFVIAIALLLAGLIFAFTRESDLNSSRSSAYRLIVVVFMIYFLAVIMHVLAFYPSRHMLVFVPAIFVFVGLASGDIVRRFRISPIIIFFTWLLVVALGILSLPPIIAKSRSISIGPIDNDISQIYIDGWGEPPEYVDWEKRGVNVPVELIKPASFAPEKNKIYLYVSNDIPFQECMQRLAKKRPYQKSQPVFEVISEYHYTTGVCFTGFPVDRCSYGEPNQIYKTKFRLVQSD